MSKADGKVPISLFLFWKRVQLVRLPNFLNEFLPEEANRYISEKGAGFRNLGRNPLSLEGDNGE